MKCIALLRGLNVGPHNRLKMPALAALFEQVGCREVSTYIQSGNVLFTATDAVYTTLAERVPALLAKTHGVTSPVVLRTAKELAAVPTKNPFDGAPEDTLHVAFLSSRPAHAQVTALDPQRSPGDRFQVVGREVYLHLPNGVARTRLTNAWLDSRLECVSTVRNWKTVRELTRLALA